MVYLKSLLVIFLFLFSTVSFSQEIIINKLKQGGYTIFFRHSITPGEDPKQNPTHENPYNCGTQRQLNSEGREQAELIGRKFKEHNIPIGEVYSSPICRCLETATLAFGKPKSVDWMSVGTRVSSQTELKKHLLTAPASGTNNIYIGHAQSFSNNLLGNDFPKLFLKEGQGVVIDPITGQIVARIYPTRW